MNDWVNIPTAQVVFGNLSTWDRIRVAWACLRGKTVTFNNSRASTETARAQEGE